MTGPHRHEHETLRQVARRRARRLRARLRRSALEAMRSWIGPVTVPLWREAPCLFVLSTGRAGTSTLRHLLSLSPVIDAHHEPRPKLLKPSRRARIEVHETPERFWKTFVRARGFAILAARRSGKMYAETSNRLTYFAPVLAARMPQARFIHLHRDPRDVVRSGMRRRWYHDHPADPFRPTPVEGEEGFERWPEWGPFDRNCWYWDACNRFALEFIDGVEPGRVLSVRSDDLFSGAAVPGVFTFLGISAPSDSDVRKILDARHNAQRDGAYPTSDSWDEERHRKLLRIARPTIERLGYEA